MYRAKNRPGGAARVGLTPPRRITTIASRPHPVWVATGRTILVSLNKLQPFLALDAIRIVVLLQKST